MFSNPFTKSTQVMPLLNRIAYNNPNVNITWVYFLFLQGSTSQLFLRLSSSDTSGACGIPSQRQQCTLIHLYKPRNKQCEQHLLQSKIPRQFVQLCSIPFNSHTYHTYNKKKRCASPLTVLHAKCFGFCALLIFNKLNCMLVEVIGCHTVYRRFYYMFYLIVYRRFYYMESCILFKTRLSLHYYLLVS